MSDSVTSEVVDSIQNYDMPSRKAILQYLVRMGSFTSEPKYPNEDTSDDDIVVPISMTWSELKERCRVELGGYAQSIPRSMVDVGGHTSDSIRIMQWNILAQALAIGSDDFIRCPIDSLTSWNTRRWRLLSEIIDIEPDILCLQEVDHYKFFERFLGSVGLVGTHCPKPDSPCLYILDNNGPDGCALFINTNRFDIIETTTRGLEVWGFKSNQVAILCRLRRISDGSEICVVTTHLKARPSVFHREIRREQGTDIVDFVTGIVGDNTPLLLAGDMNANPGEPLHSVWSAAGLESAYLNLEPSYTSWTFREDGEHCDTLDYIMYKKKSFLVDRILQLPSKQDIGPNGVPSERYPSDHLALVADVSLNYVVN